MKTRRILLFALGLILWYHPLFGQFSGGKGSPDEPFKVATAADLSNVRNYRTFYFIQIANIDLSGTNWVPIAGGGTADLFTGNYDGNGYTISNLVIDRPSTANVGLFGHLGEGTLINPAVIRDVHLVNVNVAGGRGTGSLVGRVTGNIYTLIEGCSASGVAEKRSVTGDAATGGLVGSNNSATETPGGTNNPIISKCWAAIDVTYSGAGPGGLAAEKFGGLSGCNQKGTILDSYARGSVTVERDAPWSWTVKNIGGLAGCILYRGVIERSYATGAVTANADVDAGTFGGLVGNVGTGGNKGVVVDSYWDTETTTQGSSAGGTGLTTAQMKDQSNFIGFDFTNVWDIDDGSTNDGYPFLRDVSVTKYVTWKRAFSDDWNTAGNWSSDGVPGANDIAYVPMAGTYPIIHGAAPTVKGLSIADGANLTIGPQGKLTVTDVLLSSDTASAITIQSDGTHTGSLIAPGGKGLITVERWLVHDQWHIVGVPVQGQDIETALLLPANSIASHGSDPVTYGGSAYNEGTNNWNAYYNSEMEADSFKLGEGYLIRRGGANGVVSFTGILANSEVPWDITRTGYGWNCLGNPYPSALAAVSDAAETDFLTTNAGALDDSFEALYVWDPGANDYVIVNHAKTGWDTDYLQSGQGFIVRADAAGQATFTSDMQSHQPTQEFKSGGTPWPGFVVAVTKEEHTARTILSFHTTMTAGLDPGYDAGVFKHNPELVLYTQLLEDNGVDFGLQCLPQSSLEGAVIPLGIEMTQPGEVTFHIRLSGMPENRCVVLEDRLSEQSTWFTHESDVYMATLAEEDTGYGRFYLSVGEITGSKSIPEDPFTVYYRAGKLYLHKEIQGKGEAALYDLNGRKIAGYSLNHTNRHIIAAPPVNGIYIVKVQDETTIRAARVLITND
jgi:hypothetical protein